VPGQLISAEALLPESLGRGTALPGVEVGEMQRRARGAARSLTDRYGLRDRHAALRSRR
jgi:hypothetical protein